jgi:glucan phosphoethanolaminetransferase (alkaline phosphatase superfamily)
MIQRKQSIFLALAVVFLVQLFIFPVYGFEKDGQFLPFYIYGLGSLSPDYFATIALNVFSIFLLVAIIFLYKNRKQQLLLCKIATLLITALIVAIFYFAENAKSLPELAGYTSEIRPMLVTPLAALVMVILANRAIKQDEELVRSADRLR